MYATLTQLKQYIDIDSTDTADDNRLLGFLLTAAATVDAVRPATPARQTLRFDYPIRRTDRFGAGFSAQNFVTQMNAVADYSAGRLALNADLLELESVTNGDGADITSDVVTESANLYPKQILRIVTPGVAWQPGANGQREQVIAVTGVWGWHPTYTSAWQGLDALSGSASASVTTLAVSDADGPDEHGLTPRFQAGQLIKVDSEYMGVSAVTATTGSAAVNTLTVTRAQAGTVAAAHAIGAAVYVYRPPQRIVHATLRLATWLYRQKDANVFDKTTMLNTGVVITPSALPPDVREMLPPHRLTI